MKLFKLFKRNHPQTITQNITKMSDFVLDCIVSQTLYKVRVGATIVGLVHIEGDQITYYHSNTGIREGWRINDREDYKDRVEVKKYVLEIIKREQQHKNS
jgi:hypothetical protein